MYLTLSPKYRLDDNHKTNIDISDKVITSRIYLIGSNESKLNGLKIKLK